MQAGDGAFFSSGGAPARRCVSGVVKDAERGTFVRASQAEQEPELG